MEETKDIILVVDDDVVNLKLAKTILDDEYRVATINSGAMVFEYLDKNAPSLVLLDIDMPEMDGFEVMQKIASNKVYATIPVIFLTAKTTPSIEAKCLETGAIDFIGKPFVPAVLKSRVKRTLELMQYRNNLEAIVEQQTKIIENKQETLINIQNAVISGMANLIELRDNYTGKHVKNTQVYVEMICSALSEQNMFADILTEDYKNNTIKAAPLHDVGKIKISDAILQKPAKLTPEEYLIMQAHTVYGAEIVSDILGEVENPDYLKIAHDIALYHHEQWNGKGYPEKLAGENIPLCARIMAIADVFDALYEDRCYKKGIRPAPAALEIIKQQRGEQFDPVITDVFLGLEDKLREYLHETVKKS